MSLVIFSNSECNYLWPLIEETVEKITKINKIFVCDVLSSEKPKGFDKYISYDNNKDYTKIWTDEILPNIESNYILIVHDIQIIVNIDEEFILNHFKLMSEYSIHRCSLNVFDGNCIVEKYGIKLCDLNYASGNTFTPYDVCPAIWDKKSLMILFKIFPDETCTTSELNDRLQIFCRKNFKCCGQKKTTDKIYYCLGRPYLNNFKILHITIKKELLGPLEVYMDMKDDFIYYLNKYKLYEILSKNNDYAFILNNFREI